MHLSRFFICIIAFHHLISLANTEALHHVSSKLYRELLILHTNDMHARALGVTADDSMCGFDQLFDENCFGGFDRIHAQVRKERSQHENVLVLDAGDQFQGTMFHQLYQGKVAAQFMNSIGYDAMAVGNHEFDDGPEILAQFSEQIRFPLLSANIDVSKSEALKNRIKKHIILSHNGLRIGVLGYTTPDTRFLSSPGEKVRFLPIIESVRHSVSELRRAKVDVIVAVSHSGLNTDIEVARRVSGIAVIISGHSNSLLSNHDIPKDGPCPLVIQSPEKNPVLLVSAYAYGKYLGKLQFTFDSAGVPKTWNGDPILLDQSVPRSHQIIAQLKEFYQPIHRFESQYVGQIPVSIDAARCRFQECVFGNLLTDAMLEYTKKFGVSIALMNGGAIRAPLERGKVSEAQLITTMPFDKTLVLLKLTGATIKAIIEHGVSFAEDSKNDNTGRFLQVSGLQYSFDSTRPRGKRVEDIFLVDVRSNTRTPLVLDKSYGVVTNSYLAHGGDDYTQFNLSTERWSINLELKALLKNFLKTALSQLPSQDGRIIDLSHLRAKHSAQARTHVRSSPRAKK